MSNATFLSLISLISQYSYHLVFIAMLAEGPVVTMAASFAAGSGIFNIYIIFVLSILGDVLADFVYYAIGYMGRKQIIDRYGHFFGLTSKRIEKLENLIHDHYLKTLVAIKLTPFISAPGLVLTGASKIPFRKFLIVVLAITLPKSLLFTTLGYTFGKANYIAVKYFKLGQYGLIIGFILILFISYLYQKISIYLAEKLEKL